MLLVFLYLFISQVKKEYTLAILFAGSLLLFYMAGGRLSGIVSQIRQLEGYLPIRNEHLVLLLKIAGISYLSELSSSICRDAGLTAFSGQVEMIGKLTILGFSIPVVLSLFETIQKFF